jgi:Holliday junction resolvase-like predicted endonuclease
MSTQPSQSTIDRQKQDFIQKLAEVFTKSQENKEKQPAPKGGKLG